ncbi:MAG: DNA cytosine methyltransferase, partial [Pseudomonadota bacterium]
MERKPTVLEFFAGGGMARLGLEPWFRCVFANDIDPGKAASYRANFGADHLIEADIANLKTEDLPTADLAWASFPCQDLSLAGPRGGLKATRSGTFWTFWHLIMTLDDEVRCPDTLVLENVPGLLTSNAGADFAGLIAALVNAGFQVGAAIMDAADFVPQSRARLFLIATRAVPAERLTCKTPGKFHPAPLIKSVERLDATLRANWV